MKPHEKSLQRLMDAARKAPGEAGDLSAPYGFSTRVAALAMERASSPTSVFARLSLRAAAVACLLAAASVATNFNAIEASFSEEAVVAAPASQQAASANAAPAASDDPIAEVVDAASS